MNMKNVIALVLAIVIAVATFGIAAANAEASDRVEEIAELLELGYSWFDDTEDKAYSYDVVTFSAKLLTIKTADAGSRVTNFWTFENEFSYYCALNALIYQEQSDCLFINADADNVYYANIDDEQRIYLAATIAAEIYSKVPVVYN